MIKLTLTRLAVAVGGLALSLTAGAGAASADPNLGPAVNTTCNYQQFVNARDPSVAEAFNSSPQMQCGLHQFLAAPPSQRQQMAQRTVSRPANQPYLGVIQQAFNTCYNY
jgi:hemophore-related protein